VCSSIRRVLFGGLIPMDAFHCSYGWRPLNRTWMWSEAAAWNSSEDLTRTPAAECRCEVGSLWNSASRGRG